MGKINETIRTQLDNLEDPVARQITEATMAKWEMSTKLLKGLKGQVKRNMAILLENTLQDLKRKGMLSESSATQSAAGFEGWSNVALPLVRRVFANLLANEIVSVQPMNLPSGLVFYLDFTFGTTGVGEKDNRQAGQSLFGNTSSSGEPTGGYYGGVNFSYTRNFLSGNFAPLATGVLTASSIEEQNPASGYFITASWADVDYSPVLSSSFSDDGGQIIKKIVLPILSMSNVDETLVKAITLSSNTAGTIAGVYRAYNKYDAGTSTFTFIISGTSKPKFDSCDITGSWLRKTTQDFRGDFEIGQTGIGNNPIPELNIVVRSKPVVAQTRKLKASWTPELQQDLSAYHDIEAEAELTSMLADQISLEIDREILDNLLTNGEQTNKFYWSRNLGTFLNSRNGSIASVGQDFYGTQQDWYQTLIETLLEASNAIHKKTLRGAANFIVTSPEVCTMLEATHTFRPQLSLDEKEVKYSLGLEKVGTLNGRWTVYKDPFFQTNKVLLGYKGANFLENGFIYSPYVPLILTPTVLEPDNFTPRKGIMTRYARTTVRPEFYAAVIITDMRTG